MQDMPLVGLQGPSREPCCGPTAVSILTHTPFTEVFDWMKRNLGKRSSWRGTTTIDDLEAALHHFGARIRGRITLYRTDRRVSYRTWARCYAKPNTRYLVVVTGHAMAYENGFFADQHYPYVRRVDDDKLGRKYLWYVLELA